MLDICSSWISEGLSGLVVYIYIYLVRFKADMEGLIVSRVRVKDGSPQS